MCLIEHEYFLEEFVVKRKEQTMNWEAVDAIIDEALAAVQSANDIEVIHECRNRFRKKVPLFSRAYAAAAMALMLSGNYGLARGKRKTSHHNGKGTEGDDTGAKQTMQRFTGEGATIFISAGRRQRMFPRIIIKMIAAIPGMDPSKIGNIRIMDNYSFIIVEPSCAETVIAGLNGKMYKGRPLIVNHARKKDELETDAKVHNDMQNDMFDDAMDTADTDEFSDSQD